MASVSEAVQVLAEAMTGIEQDVDRVLEVLENEELSPEAQQAVDALKARMDTVNARMDEAVPPAPVEPVSTDSFR